MMHSVLDGGALSGQALAAMRLLAAILLLTTVDAALGGGGCDSTLGDRVALAVLARLSRGWYFWRRHGPQ